MYYECMFVSTTLRSSFASVCFLEWSAHIKVQNCLYSSLMSAELFVYIGIWQSVLCSGAWRFVQQVMGRQGNRNRSQQEAILGATFTVGYMCVRYA